MTKFDSVNEDFKIALDRFNEVLKKKKSDIVRDSAIKRFELTFDLAWKTIKAYLEEFHNSTCVSPQSCFKEAFTKGIIDYDDYWIEIAKIRNRTVYTYSEPVADEVFKDLPKVLIYFQKLTEKLNTAQANP